MLFEIVVICTFYELRKSFTVFMAIYIISLSLFNYPLEDYWNKVIVDALVYSLVSLVIAMFLHSVMSIAFIKSKAAES